MKVGISSSALDNRVHTNDCVSTVNCFLSCTPGA